MKRFDVLIVGGGHAGAQTAVALRQQGFAGSIAIIGDEPELPYDRPPLSKEYLAGDKPWEQLVFRTAEQWAERGVDLILGARVVAVDAELHRVETAEGTPYAYDTLVWAAGGSPRRLGCEGSALAGIHGVRNRADVDRMISELPQVRDVVVVGGGYIGLEAAAVLGKLGKKIVVVEALDRVLARVAGEPLSRFYEAAHRARGTEIRLGTSVEAIVGEGGAVTGVRLAGGEILPAQMVIVGIGIIPEVGPLLAAGAAGSSGVAVDDRCRTSLADVYAVGDCAEHENIWCEGRSVRLESVQNANDQAMTAAKSICGAPEPYRAMPWFWSNQFDLKLQTIGVSGGHDDLVVRGDMANASFSLVYLRGGVVIALDCVNAARDYSHGRLMIAAGSRPDRDLLADSAVPLKTLV